jgi:type II secretory pathway component PulJ
MIIKKRITIIAKEINAFILVSIWHFFKSLHQISNLLSKLYQQEAKVK